MPKGAQPANTGEWDPSGSILAIPRLQNNNSPAGQGLARASVRVAAAPSGNRATTQQTQPGACARMARARLEADRSRPYLAWLRRDGVTVTQLGGPWLRRTGSHRLMALFQTK